MDIRKIAAGAGVAAIALGAALPAAALTSSSASNLTGSVGATVGVTGSGSGSTSGSTDINVGVNANGSGSTGTSTGSSNNSITGDVTANGSASGSDNALMITRADIDSNAVDSTSWDSSRTSSDVQSNADLKAYVASQMKNDTNLSSVESNSSDVAVTYKQRGHFLGFIPVTVNATAMVDQNGQVSVKYPWYTFLTTTDRADLQAKLQAQVDAMDGRSSGSTNASIQLTADTQARLVDQMRRTMNDEFNGSATATANANANTSASGNY